MKDLPLDVPTHGSPGDSFRFDSSTGSTQYRIEVSPNFPQILIGVWPEQRREGRPGIARNAPGLPYVDRTLPAGRYEITVEVQTGPRDSGPAPAPYVITATARSPWNKWFPWWPF